MNRGKQLALQRLVQEIGVIDLSDSDIDDQQDRVAEVEIVTPIVTVPNSPQVNGEPVNDTRNVSAEPSTSGTGQNDVLLVTDGLAGPLYKFVQDVSICFTCCS